MVLTVYDENDISTFSKVWNVSSNHETLCELVEWYGIPYHHVPVPKEPEAKQAAFEKTAELIEQAEPDTIVLVRYIQIFPLGSAKNTVIKSLIFITAFSRHSSVRSLIIRRMSVA